MGDAIDENKAFIGRVSLYNELSKPAYRSFLQRNLRAVLDVHGEGRVAHALKTKVEEKERWDLFERMAGREVWEAAMKGSKPVLRIEGLKLRKGTGKREIQAEDENEDGNPDWLPRDDETRMPCQVTLAILEPRHDWKPCYINSLPGTITSRHGGQWNAAFDIKLHVPFEVNVEKLLATTTPSHAPDGWERGLADKYDLEVAIHLQDAKSTAEFLGQIHGRDPSEYLGVPGNDSIIWVNWNKLPDLPQPGVPLHLRRGRGKKCVDLPIGAEICMSWNQRVSPLVTCNRTLKLERGERQQLPTPASEDLERSRFLVKYLFRQAFQTRTLLTRELKCILCERKAEHSSFERLRLHYLTHHDHLEFQASDDPDILDCKILRISIPEERPSDEKLKENEWWQWQAPGQPFDIEAHLEGDAVWTNENMSHSNTRQRGTTRAAAQKAKSKQINPPRSPLLVPARPKRELVPPENVPDLPEKRRRRHRVPRVPYIHFYRTTSKQQVEQGMEISDSDEEADEGWLEQSQRRHLLDLELDGFAVDFHQLFNKHLSEERPMSDRLTRDAMIRFARKFKSKLSEPGWSAKFRAKLDQLKSRKVIDRDVVQYCMGIVANEMQRAEQPSTPEQEAPPNGSNVFLGSPGGYTPDVMDEAPPLPVPEKNTFGRRQIICVRPSTAKSSSLIPIKDLVDEDYIDKPIDSLQPQDLDWNIFLSILDRDLIYIRDADYIWCSTTKKGTPLITDAGDWTKVLSVAREETKGPIRFELIDHFTLGQKLDAVGQQGIEMEDEARKAKKAKKDLCVCGEKVATMRKTIACANAKCNRAFHLGCVGLEKRSFEWRCVDCT